MDTRLEFVTLANKETSNVRQLCRQFGISPRTAYLWINRYKTGGYPSLEDRSRKPKSSSSRTDFALEEKVVDVRQRHPAWGGRKIRARLQALGVKDLPAASTITDILHRHGLISPDSAKASAGNGWQRFERQRPNELWQMDFKGNFATAHGRCFPLTILDDCSRYSLALQACLNEQRLTVQEHLQRTFERYGLPEAILADNGNPWGLQARNGYTRLHLWLIRLGIRLHRCRPYHPQTQGKEERFHRTLKAEVLIRPHWRDLAECQSAFDSWRMIYNHERPHEALNMAVPASRYEMSIRSMPKELPPIEYGPDDIVKKVSRKGRFGYKGKQWYVGEGFMGLPVALRPTTQDGIYDIFFVWKCLGRLNLHLEKKEQSIYDNEND